MRTLYFYLCFVLFFANAQAQTFAYANVASNVNAVLSINKTVDLGFLIVRQGETTALLSTDAGAATFIITGEVSTSTSVTVTFPVNLISGTNTLSFTGQTSIYNTVSIQGTTTAFSSLTGDQTSLSSTGQLFL